MVSGLEVLEEVVVVVGVLCSEGRGGGGDVQGGGAGATEEGGGRGVSDGGPGHRGVAAVGGAEVLGS